MYGKRENEENERTSNIFLTFTQLKYFLVRRFHFEEGFFKSVYSLIWQSIPDNEIAWACGDGSNGTGNRKSISIEICVNQDGNYEKAKNNAIWFIQYLMRKHNIPIGQVVPHKKWSGKACPRKLLPHWSEFLRKIEASGVSKPSIPKYPSTLLRRGSKGENVKLIQQKLGGLSVDGIFGPKTEAAVRKFQKLKGLVSDGIVGLKTWSSLMK